MTFDRVARSAFVFGLALAVWAAPWPEAASWAGSPAEAQLAQADAAEIAFWESVRNSQVPEELRAYLDAYPDGHFAALARIRLQQLSPASVPETTGSAEGFAPFAFDHAVQRQKAGDQQGAIRYLQLAVAQDPERALFREVLGDAYLALGSRETAYLAIEEYGRALELAPGSVAALAGLRQAALLADEPLVALDATEALFLRDGAVDLGLLPDLAMFYILLDQSDRGLAKLGEALGRSEAEAAAAIELNLAALHRYRGEPEAALRLATSARARVAGDSKLAAVAQDLIDQVGAP